MSNTQNQLKCEITGSPYEAGSFSDRVHRYIDSTDFAELDLNLKGVVENPNELFIWFDGLIGELYEHSKVKLSKIDLADNLYQEKLEYTVVYQMWDKVGFYLLQNFSKLPDYLVRFYQKFLLAIAGAQNYSSRKYVRLHKGGIYHNLGISFLHNGQKEKSLNYFFLGVVEDILHQSDINSDDFKKAPGYSNLRSLGFFGNEEDTIKAIRSTIIKHKRNKELIWIARPELIFLELVTDAKSEIKVEHSLNWDKDLFALLLNQIDHSTKKLLGKYLELIAIYLFFTNRPFEVKRNVLTLHSENDLRVRSLIDNDPILELLGRYFLVECKNWIDPVDSKTMKTFISNVRFARCETGILISKNGITGSRSRDNAWFVVRAEYHKDNVIILVLDRKDLDLISEEKTKLLDLLKSKYEQIRFDER